MTNRWTRLGRAIALASVLLSAASMAQIDGNTVGWGVEPMEISRVGSAGWQFLKLPTDARSASLGGIRSALSYGNASSVFGNPASSVDVTDMDLQLSSMKWVADIGYSSASFVKNFGPWGAVGINCIYLDYGRMVRTVVGQAYDASGNDLGIVPITEGLGTFTAHDLAAGVSYARQITDLLQVGGTIRYMEQKIDDAPMRSWAIDIGTLYRTGIGSLRISMVGRNFGPDGEFKEYEGRIAQAPAKVKMPMMFLLGGAYDILEGSAGSSTRLTVAAEYLKPNDGADKFHVGAECFLLSLFYLRGGYKFNYDEEDFTIGAGVEYSIEDDIRLKFDYAYANVGRFAYVNMFTLGFGL